MPRRRAGDGRTGGDRRGRGVRRAPLVGIRTAWKPVADGEFFCTGCGGDRNYQRLTGRRRFAVLGLPLVPRGTADPVVECAACHTLHPTYALERPTTHRLSAMLRDAVHTVALAVLAADGTCERPALDAAAGAVRAAGFEDCTGEQLGALVAALAADTGRLPGQGVRAGQEVHGGQAGRGLTGLAIELHEALDPLAPWLAPAGRQSVLAQGALIALADGAYTPAEREVLGTVGTALTLGVDEVASVLESVRATSS